MTNVPSKSNRNACVFSIYFFNSVGVPNEKTHLSFNFAPTNLCASSNILEMTQDVYGSLLKNIFSSRIILQYWCNNDMHVNAYAPVFALIEIFCFSAILVIAFVSPSRVIYEYIGGSLYFLV